MYVVNDRLTKFIKLYMYGELYIYGVADRLTKLIKLCMYGGIFVSLSDWQMHVPMYTAIYGNSCQSVGLQMHVNPVYSYMLKLLSVCRIGRCMYICIQLYVEIIVSLSDLYAYTPYIQLYVEIVVSLSDWQRHIHPVQSYMQLSVCRTGTCICIDLYVEIPVSLLLVHA